ncbi:MAG: cytochrome c [Planctomycetes bacterium]|nr:cytochrome c [Planctomycetota bacterium]
MTDPGRFLPIILLNVCAMLGTGCDGQLPGKPNPADMPVPAERELAFDAIYGRHCAGCHGADGTRGAAPPLNDPLFRALVSQSELEIVLNGGRQGEKLPSGERPKTQMAPFAHSNGGPLSAIQVQVLVHEIKGMPYRIVSTPKGPAIVTSKPGEGTITPCWGMPNPAPASVPAYTLPPTMGNVAEGLKVYANACASCHGENGNGVFFEGKLHKKINDQAFLALTSDQELRRIIITGRGDLGMPNYLQKTDRPDDFHALTSENIVHLNALLSSWRIGGSK